VDRGSLARAFRSSWRGEATPDEDAALDAALGAALERARTAWPDLSLDDTTFVTHLAARLAAKAPWREELAKTAIEELFLACACYVGETRALATLDARFLDAVPRYVAHLDRSPAFAEDVRQALREKLLLGPGGAAKIGEYAGRGPLGGWLRVAAIRTGLNARRGRARADAPTAELGETEAAPGHPEVDLLRARYAGAVQHALEVTVRALPVDQRNVLRMHYLDDLSIDRVAAVYGVHRSTAARWIADAREAILAETMRRLGEELAATGSEIRSIVALVQSQLDMSLRALLPTE
jgi:RNA polymerase sigma-70 factor (ECF subfamily)